MYILEGFVFLPYCSTTSRLMQANTNACANCTILLLTGNFHPWRNTVPYNYISYRDQWADSSIHHTKTDS